MTDPTIATTIEVATGGEGSKQPPAVVVATAPPIRPICPLTGLECMEQFPCEYRENPANYTGKTLCMAWVNQQREQGRKALETNRQDSSKTRT